MRSHTRYYTAQVEQVQTVLLLFLFQRGARDSANYYGQTVLDLIESEDMRRMVRVRLPCSFPAYFHIILSI